MLMVGVVASVLVTIPGARRAIPQCAFHELTGAYCPGCGTTRMLEALMHGDIGTALAMNPLGLVLLPFIGYVLVRDTLELFGMARLPELPRRRWFVVALAATVVAYWVLRNLPMYPFTLLAPG